MSAQLARAAIAAATVCLAAGAGSQVWGAPSAEFVRDPVGVSMTVEETPFGCRINVQAMNKGTRRVAISRDSQVKAGTIGGAFGIWAKLDVSVWISPGATARWTYNLDLGCSINRQFRFYVKQFDASDRMLADYWYYYPGETGATKETSLNLGDLNRFF
jgi:hypothetical protein